LDFWGFSFFFVQNLKTRPLKLIATTLSATDHSEVDDHNESCDTVYRGYMCLIQGRMGKLHVKRPRPQCSKPSRV